MVRKKLDNRIRVLIENGVALGHRSFFVMVGDKSRDQVVILHHILSKSTVKARPSVLWCYKKELGFSTHRKKRMRQLKKKIQTGKDINEDDPFELFVSSTEIRYCYYSETHKILGNTFGMCVLQDFEALTPNLLARTIETVEGGGLVVILLRSLTSLRQLYTMAMDVHSRYRTEVHQDVVGRFNERFILSLASCKTCMVLDDQMNILPISCHVANIEAVPPRTKDAPTPNELELKELIESLQDAQPVGVLVKCCKTLDQAKCLLKFFDVITEKTLKATVSLTAARGRGKSAALGLAMAGAVAFGYSNIFVTSPSPENLKTLFEFVMKGFDCLEYQEHIDYELVQSNNPEFNKSVIRVNVFRDHRQTIQYIHPSDASKLGQAELIVIDEAAAIPLPFVKEMMGPYLVFMASTINGYEGTGRSLSLKLLQQLREQTAAMSASKSSDKGKNEKELISVTGRTLTEIALEESIRYRPGDNVEGWLNNLLCLDATSIRKLPSGCPSPSDCDLYLINRDTLFCFHKASETFLQRMMSIYVAAHYKNTPNDLQMISDAPAHQLYCLLGPVDPNQTTLPEILCVVQLCLEGELSKSNVVQNLTQGKRASGDLIPWTVAQQFQDNDFPSLCGARIVRIATHPDYQGVKRWKMGYGSRALQLLTKYFEGKITNINENGEISNDEKFPESVTEHEDVGLLEEQIAPRKNLPPLLSKLSERKPVRLDWLGVSYGLTNNLLKFWKRNGFVPVYLRQTTNDLTGEHSCIQLKLLNSDSNQLDEKSNWLAAYYKDFRRRFLNLLSYQFRSFPSSLSLNILQHKTFDETPADCSRLELSYHLTNYDLKRLELYGQNLVDHHLITDLLPEVARLYFLRKINVHLSVVQGAILLSSGLQHKITEEISKELDLPSTQLMGLFNRTIRKIVQKLNSICEAEIETNMGFERSVDVRPANVSLDDDLNEAALETNKKLAKEKRKLMLDDEDLSAFAIRGNEDDWSEALKEGAPTGGLMSVKRTEKNKRKLVDETADFSKKSKSFSKERKTKRRKT